MPFSAAGSVGVAIEAGSLLLHADVCVPTDAAGVVLFAHGSGSSRRSPRNRFVAGFLNGAGIATVLADLLTEDEAEEDAGTGQYRFDIGRLADRVRILTDWAMRQTGIQPLPLGYFGASTGAAAALVAAADDAETVRAVVSRGGRPDLAGPSLGMVLAPCLFIVGGADGPVLQLNREAMAQLPPATERQLAVIPGASHLFEEPGALEQVAALARDWLLAHFL
jgi:putative phosphoribosyl transferase